MEAQRLRLVCNLLVSIANALIALVVLLIAPLGLAAVITLTLLIGVSTFLCFTLGDWLQDFLRRGGGGQSRLGASPSRPPVPGKLPSRSDQRRLP